jgi:phage repressor protein C with HTH and peptisase S24 domain
MKGGAASDRIMRAMREAGVTSAAELGRLSGINETTARSYANGTRKPPLDVALEIGRALNVSGRWIFDGTGKPSDANPAYVPTPNARDPRPIDADARGALLPVYGVAMGGDDGKFELNGQTVDRIAAPPGLRGATDAYAVYVVGESMEPRYYAGETVYVHPGKPVRKGDFVVVQLNPKSDGEPYAGLIKRLVAHSDVKVVVEQFNPPRRIEFDRSQVGAIHRIVLSGE